MKIKAIIIIIGKELEIKWTERIEILTEDSYDF